MNVDQFNDALNEKKRGKWIRYGRSDMTADGTIMPPDSDIMTAAYRAYKSGKCVLVQKRVEWGIFDYIAVKL